MVAIVLTWKLLSTTRMTSQCQRYVPYEILPRYTTERCDSARFTTPPEAASSATMITHVAIVTATPRSIASRSTHDDANTRRAPMLTTVAVTIERRNRDAAATNAGTSAINAPARSS